MSFAWDDLRLFLAVAREGGLAGAARATSTSAPTVLRAINRFEAALGQSVFTRGPRGYRLTETGERVLAEAQEAERSVARIARAAGAPEQRRIVRLSAGTWMARLVLCRLGPTFAQADTYQVEIISTEQVARIEHRAVDIGLRNQRPAARGLATRRLFKVLYAVYAERTVADDADLPWIVVQAETPSARWVRQRAGMAIAIEVNTPVAALDAVRAGCGRYVLPTFIGDHEPNLVRTNPDADALSHSCWLTLNDATRHEPEVRAVVSALVVGLGTLTGKS